MPTFRDAFTGDIVSRDNFDFIDSSEHRERARQQRVEYERI